MSLIERVRDRDPAAWVRLVELYEPVLDGWCLHAKLQAADAADVKQEVFAAVLRAIGEFRRDRPGDSFRGWLFGITRNKILDRLRRVKEAGAGGSDVQRQLAAIPAIEPDSEPPASPDDDRILYRRALEQIQGEFEPQTWLAFWRVTAEERSAADVAAELSMSRNAVYLARSRVLAKLRKEFQGLLPNDPATPPEGE